MIRHIFYIILAIAMPHLVNAQDTIPAVKKLTVAGYMKSLQNLSFDKHFNELTSGNLLHNRINMKWKPGGHTQVVAEFRNRLFWGEEIRMTPGFASLLRNPSEKINLQKVWIDKNALVLHTNVERLYVEHRRTKWNLRLGRQRINWSITTNWNPNDIFNTYNFLDFDYEERPGVDAVKAQYSVDGNFNMEAAYAKTRQGSVGAIKYAINKWNYDFQLITGWYNEQATIGMGWAGAIGDAGFKGEMQHFFGNHDSSGHFNLAMEGDYMFDKGWYLNAGFLFNSNGMNQGITNWEEVDLKLSPSNLMPTKWTMMVTVAKEFTPLFSANMGVLYAPGTQLLILLPSIRYSLADNLDAGIVWQSFFADIDNEFAAINHRGFLRLKFSF